PRSFAQALNGGRGARATQRRGCPRASGRGVASSTSSRPRPLEGVRHSRGRRRRDGERRARAGADSELLALPVSREVREVAPIALAVAREALGVGLLRPGVARLLLVVGERGEVSLPRLLEVLRVRA